MTQKPLAARNSDSDCLRGIDGMPSHNMINFLVFRPREGGRNSATISFLNLVLSISGHYLRCLESECGIQSAIISLHVRPTLDCCSGRISLGLPSRRSLEESCRV